MAPSLTWRFLLSRGRRDDEVGGRVDRRDEFEETMIWGKGVNVSDGGVVVLLLRVPAPLWLRGDGRGQAVTKEGAHPYGEEE